MNEAAHDCLPVPVQNNGKGKTVSGWNSDVKQFKDISLFWAAVWKSAGRPINNGLYQIMKKCKNLYHHQAKKCFRAQDHIKKSKLLKCFTDEGTENNDIFKEVKKLRTRTHSGICH